jgi:glycosyltransferase involved in cell wall biosynthesis
MQVAVDATPLLGAVTGVGQTVRGLLEALPGVAPDVEVARWELTRRTVPVPPRLLVRAWSRFDHPRADRWLPAADVVHGTNFVVPPSRRPCTVTVHDSWCARGGRCDPTIAAATATVRRAVDRGAWLHVSTEWMAGEVRDLYGAERVRVVPFGVPAVPEAAPRAGTYVLALGDEADHRKGIDVLRAAMRELPDVELVVAGGANRVDDATRASLLRGAAVLAYPSRDEGFGFPVLEAMTVGVPAVASAVGGVPEVAGDAALLVPRDDPGALAAALRTALSDSAERERLVTAGRARASSYSWEAHAAGMVRLWRDAREAG